MNNFKQSFFAGLFSILTISILTLLTYKTELDILLAESDGVSVHIPLNKETNNMINKNWFKKMKKGSYFVTTSRGSIHNEDDLYDIIYDLSEEQQTQSYDINTLRKELMDKCPSIISSYHFFYSYYDQ